MSEADPTRRELIKTAMLAGAGFLQQASAQPSTNQSTTQPATSSTQRADASKVEDVAAADKIAGRDAHNDADRALMLEELETTRTRLKKYRAVKLDPRTEPAIRFDPRLPTTKVPTGSSSFTLSSGEA